MSAGQINYTSKRRQGTVRIDGQVYKVRAPKTRVDQRLSALYQKYAPDPDSNGDPTAAARTVISPEDVDEMVALHVSIFANNDGTKTRPSSRQRILDRLDDEDDDLDISDLQDVMRLLGEKWAGDRPTRSPGA